MDHDIDDLLGKLTEEIIVLRSQIALLEQQEHKHVWLMNSLTDPGWMPLPVTTGNFVSANSFTMAGDLTAFFKVGTKVRLINIGTKFNYVVSSSYNIGTGLTTVNVIGDVFTNAAIANLMISYSNPPDFQTIFSYLATATGSGGSAGSYAEDNAWAIYSMRDREVSVTVRKRITNLGSWSGDVRIALPISTVSGYPGRFGHGFVYAQGANINAPKGITSTSSGFAYTTFFKTINATLQWSDLAVNDWFYIDTRYVI